MYATDYGKLEVARGSYRELGAGACLGCANPTCLGACAQGIDIPGRTNTLPYRMGIHPDDIA